MNSPGSVGPTGRESATQLPLPSEMAGADGGSSGFLYQPTKDHLINSTATLRQLASVLSEANDFGSYSLDLQVELGHVNHQGLLAQNLFAFNLLPTDSDGALQDPISSQLPIKFAIIVNQSVDVQLEASLRQISALVDRQVILKSLRRTKEDRGQIENLDEIMADSDAKTQNELVDVLRHGWKAAAQLIARKAADAKIKLSVTHIETLLTDESDFRSRHVILRDAYNSYGQIKEAVDRFVSAIAPHGKIVSPSSVPDRLRIFLQQEYNLASFRYYIAQALRDALVFGNGYIVADDLESMSIHNLPPEASFNGDISQEMVIHFEGLIQSNGGRALGLLEAVIPSLQQKQVVDDAKRFASSLHDTPQGRSHSEWIEQVTAMSARVDIDFNSSIRSIFAPMFNFLPDPVSDLYFDGLDSL
jgi:hypothetical protein